MNSKIIKAALKPFVPKLEGFLRGLEIDEENGEITTRIMLNVEDRELEISIVAIGIENEKPVVKRVLDKLTGDDLLKD
jgi:hypothetical protein